MSTNISVNNSNQTNLIKNTEYSSGIQCENKQIIKSKTHLKSNTILKRKLNSQISINTQIKKLINNEKNSELKKIGDNLQVDDKDLIIDDDSINNKIYFQNNHDTVSNSTINKNITSLNYDYSN